MGRKIRVIINPSSGRQTMRQTVDDIIGFLVEQNYITRADFCYTRGKGDATNFAQEIKPGEYDLVLAVGGDGTLNEVVNGLIKSGTDTTLAILPAGTVNDFATYLDMPQDPYIYARMIMDNYTSKIDVGLAGTHYFLNVAAGGLLTDIAYKVPSETKTSLGRLAYWLEGAKDIPSNIFKGFNMSAESDGDHYNKETLLFLVANTTSVGGIKRLLPQAKVDDGLLDVLIVSKLEFGGFLPLLGQLMIGNHLSNENITYFQTDRLMLSAASDQDIRLDVDGEEGGVLPVEIRCIPGALTLLVPDHHKDAADNQDELRSMGES
jgi:diacylglycerol kinase (ATP)